MFLLLFPLLGMLSQPSTSSADNAASGKSPPKTSTKDDVPFDLLPEPFTAQTGRNEAADNRLKLTTLLTKARLQDHRGDLEGALQTYQRASRLSPGSPSILQEIVRLGFMLKRNEIASRYAILLAENQPTMSADALLRIANYCLEDAQATRAAELYQRAVKMLAQEDAHAQELGTQFRLLGLYLSHGEPKKAALHADEVSKMIADPKKFGLEEVIEQFSEGGIRATYDQLGETYLAAGEADKAEKMFAKSEETESRPAMALVHAAEVAAVRKDWKAAEEKLNEYLAANYQDAGKRPYELLLKVTRETVGSPEAALQNVIERLRPLHDQAPEFAPLAYFLSDLYAEQDNWDEVVLTAGPLIEADTNSAALANLCQAYTAQADWAALTTLLATGLDAQYELTRLTTPLAKLIADPEKWAAYQAYLKSLKPESLALNERIGVARLLQESDESELAWDWLQTALPDLDKQEQSRLLMQFGLKAFRSDQEVVAEKALRAAIKLGMPKSQTSLFYFYLATILEMQGKTDEALRTAKRAALLDEESALLRSRIPWILYHAGRTDQAIEEYQTLLNKFASDYDNQQTRQVVREAKRLLSSLASQNGDLDIATEWLEQVLDEYPYDTGAMNDLGYLWVDNGQNLGRGFDMIRQAVADEPGNYAYLDSLGWAYYRLGRYSDAIYQLEKAAEIAGDDDGTVFDHLGDAYIGAGQPQKAIETWKKALESLDKEKEADILKQVQEKLQQQSQR
ncbi:tetratricopeptide repeat protein [Bremerella cremea]|uniref:tetratricopeptide repeat protein n=1 Tax=Bremerella cremea TaxID=1031537 RepID=UPI001314E8BB|nr:tetratricopeptide repeat protein [Bremerella cremea]